MAVQTEVERLVRKLKRRNPAVREKALAELRALGPGVVDELLRLYEANKKQLQTPAGCWWFGSVGVMNTAMPILRHQFGLGYVSSMMASLPLMLAWALATFPLVSRFTLTGEIALALSRFDDPRALNIVASAAGYREVRRCAGPAEYLARVLRQVRVTDDGALDSTARSALLRLVTRAKPAYRRTETDLAILDAFSRIGDRRSAEAIHKLADGKMRARVDPLVREAARRCADELDRRVREADWGEPSTADQSVSELPFVDLGKHAEQMRKARKEGLTRSGCSVLLLPAMIATGWFFRDDGASSWVFPLLLGVLFGGILLGTDRVPVDVQRTLTRMVARWRSPELVGPTAEGLALDYVRDTCAVVLARMLPKIDPEKPPELTAKQRGLLWAELRRAEGHAKWRRDLVLALLPALAHIGDTQALEAARRLASGSRDAEVRAAAEAAIPGIEALLQRMRGRDTLLTPASAPSEEVPLLRPAQAEEAAEVLLRPSDGEEE